MKSEDLSIMQVAIFEEKLISHMETLFEEHLKQRQMYHNKQINENIRRKKDKG